MFSLFRGQWCARAKNLLAAATLCAGVSPTNAHAYFSTPPCLATFGAGGCVFVSPPTPTPDQPVEVAIVVGSLPSDACIQGVTNSLVGNIVAISGTYMHCGGSFPEAPLTFLYTSLQPLPAGRYTVQFTAVPDPPNGWPFGINGEFQGPISIATTLEVFATTPPPANYQGLWWNSPPGSESGWGISLAHQGDALTLT